MSKRSLIDSLEVKYPCSEEWNEMKGSDLVRFCSHCERSVNNISELSLKQAARLVRQSGGTICVRYVRSKRTGLPIFAKRAAKIAHRGGLAAGALAASLAAGAGTVLAQQEEKTAVPQIEQPDGRDRPSSGIAGYVKDQNGAVIAYAIVHLTEQETNEYKVQTADAEGYYNFSDVRPGTYRIRFEAGGFEAREVTGVAVTSEGERREDVQLGVQQVQEAVTVEALPALDSWVTTGVVLVSVQRSNPLVRAALNDDLEDVKARVMMRARVNVKDKSHDGITPLHAAVENGNLEMVQFLLERGAKPNIRDFRKRTPLMMMDEDATAELFQLLVRYGAKPELFDKNKSGLLHHLAENGASAEVFRLAAAYGVGINAVNKEGRSPLMVASENEEIEIVRALLEVGANVSLTNGGKTAWDIAEAREIRVLLETYGAIPKQQGHVLEKTP